MHDGQGKCNCEVCNKKEGYQPRGRGGRPPSGVPSRGRPSRGGPSRGLPSRGILPPLLGNGVLYLLGFPRLQLTYVNSTDSTHN
jgi:hypothetical protein